MSDIELLPCPFCGGKPVKVRVGLSEAYSYADKVVYTCSGCGVSRGAIGDWSKGGYAENSTVEARAIEKWNMRAGYTALDMTTAAAQGFRDGAAKLKEAYRAGWDASGEGWNAEYPGDAHEKPQWEVRRDKALEEIMQQVMP